LRVGIRSLLCAHYRADWQTLPTRTCRLTNSADLPTC
jgi:hypothetical protein